MPAQRRPKREDHHHAHGIRCLHHLGVALGALHGVAREAADLTVEASEEDGRVAGVA